MAGNISLGSTQKAGEGDAFIYDNSGANRNIGILAQQNAQEKQQKAAAETQKKKQDYDTQKAFYDNLSAVNTLGMRTIDLPVVTDGIDDILKYTNDLKMQGKNPLDINNVQEYMQLQGKLSKMQATVDASKTLQKQLTALDKTLATDKTGMFDQIKGYKLVQAGYSNPLADMQGASFELPLAEYNLIPQLDKVTGDNLKTLFASAKVLNDKGAVDDVNKMLGAGKQSYIQSAISLATPAINQGRITTDKVIQDATDYFDYNAKTAVYNSNKDEDQVLARDKFTLDDWFKRQKVAQGWEKIDLQKKAVAKTDTNLEQMFIDIAAGKGSTSLFNNKPNFEEMATDDNGQPLLDKNDKPIPTVYGNVTNRAASIAGEKGFLIEIKNPTTGKVQGTKFIKTEDANGNSVITQTSAYQNLQDYMTKGGYRYVGASGIQTGANKSSNTTNNSTTTQGNLGGPLQKPVKKQATTSPKTITFIDNGTEYNIPSDKVDAFMKSKPNAKRK